VTLPGAARQLGVVDRGIQGATQLLLISPEATKVYGPLRCVR
jgi:hypothetical protein